VPIRVVRLNARNPIVGVALLLVLVAVVLLVLTLGVTILAGAAVLGGAAFVVRRALRLGRRPAAPERALPPLDPANEVFAPDEVDASRRLRAGEDG
jgi:hypothetical protein